MPAPQVSCQPRAGLRELGGLLLARPGLTVRVVSSRRIRVAARCARRWNASLCALLTLAWAGVARAQEVPDASVITVYVHPWERTTIEVPEDVQLTEFVGNRDFLLVPEGKRTLYLNPHVHIAPPMESILIVYGVEHEWLLFLKAVPHRDLADKKIPLTIVNAREAAPSAGPSQPDAPPVPAEQVSPDEQAEPNLSVHMLAGRGFAWLQPHAGGEYIEQSASNLGVCLAVTRPASPWSVEMSLAIQWLDEPVDFAPANYANSSYPLSALWLGSAIRMRVRTPGPIGLSSFAGLGVHARQFSASFEKGQMPPPAPDFGAFITIGVGAERRAETLSVGLDMSAELGTLDQYATFLMTLHVGGEF